MSNDLVTTQTNENSQNTETTAMSTWVDKNTLIEEQLKAKLSTKTNNNYIVMVNKKILKFYDKTSNKMKPVRLQYRKDTIGKDKIDEIQFGIYTKVINRSQFVPLLDVEKMFYKKLRNCQIGTLDFSKDVSFEKDLRIEPEPTWKVIEITTDLFSQLFSNVYATETPRHLQFGMTGRVLTDTEILEINDYYRTYMFEAYFDTVHDLFLKAIYKARMLAFFNYKRAFIPVFIEGPLLYNPLVQNPNINTKNPDMRAETGESGFITDSYLFKKTEIVEYKKLTIHYLSNNDICIGLNFNKYQRVPLKMFLHLMFGLFDRDNFPSAGRNDYVLMNSDVLSLPYMLNEVRFNTLENYQKAYYAPIDSMHLLCARNCRKIKPTAPGSVIDDLEHSYDILENIQSMYIKNFYDEMEAIYAKRRIE